ncbi:MAG: hypothetical protein C0399_05595 [Syntrophus sp. (in: bacteria)]|nr:hypothetical protein [Syntrophus sp. (in: bacteria)]
MNRFKVLFFAFLVVIFCVSFGFAQMKQVEPAVKLPPTAAGLRIPATVQAPPTMKDIIISSKIGGIQAAEQQRVGNAAKFLLTQQFGALVNQSATISPKVSIIGKVGNRIQAEALILFLDKNIYSATLSKIDYEMEGDQVFVKQKIDHYSPAIGVIQNPGKVSDATVKLKADILKNLKITLPQSYGPKALANTPCDTIPTAVNFTNQVHTIFTKAFGSATKMIGNQSTKAAIMDILQKGTNLVAWNNIGHGNPDLIVEWNQEVIWSGDFNTTVPFQGIYNSVILLNSCDTCASPYSLKNGIMKHSPRTYIAGNKGLPIGASEEVDKYFWDYTLLQSQTMAWSLNEAQKKKNLLGYFCLAGFNGKFAEVEAGKFTEDCIPFNANNVTASQVQGRWKVIQGNMSMIDFGANKSEAEKAAQIMKHYQLDKQCFVGRPQAPMQYYTMNGKAPQGPFQGEDCIAFNPDNITASKVQGRWKVIQGNMSMIDFDQKEVEAKIAVDIIKFYGFTQQCFVGRPQAPMQYFRK